MSRTAWPVLSDVTAIAVGMGVTIGSAPSTVVQQQVLDSVIEWMEVRTRRDFITATENRYFDGNGTGSIEVDEFITVNSVAIVGWFGNTNGLALTSPVASVRSNYPNTRIRIYRGSVPAWYQYWVDRFPEGRENIEVNALWGYNTTIPAPVWQAVAYQAAALIINYKLFKSDGYLIKWQEEDVTEVRNYMDPFKYFDSGMTFKAIVKEYKRPSGVRLRRQTKPLL